MIEASWIVFTLASLALIALPGQDMILFMSRSIAQGAAAGVVTAAGVSTRLVGHTVLATLGLGVIAPTYSPGSIVPPVRSLFASV